MSKNNKNLAEDFKDTLNEVKEGYQERRDSIKNAFKEAHEVLSGTREHLSQFREDQKQAAGDLKEFLNKYKLGLKSENFDRVKDFQRFFQRLSHQNDAAAIELKEFLKKYHLGLKKENSGRLEDFLKFFNAVRGQVQTMHESYRHFQEEMAQKRNKPLYLVSKPASSHVSTRLGKTGRTKPNTKKHKKK